MESNSTPTDSPKGRLIAAAYKLFSERDPSDVSVRQIAKEADTNIGSISYHFGSKDGLYLYIVNMIADNMREKIDRFYAELQLHKQKALQTTPTNRDIKLFYIKALKAMIERGARAMLETLSENNFMHRILAREQMIPSLAFPILFEKSFERLFCIVDELLSQIDTNSSEKTIKLRSHSIYGQIQVFVFTYATINKRLGSENYSAQNIEEIIEIIQEHTENILKPFLED